MIEVIQDWIWAIGGTMFTILLFLCLCAFLISYIANRLSGYQKKETRKALHYWISHRDRIEKIIEKEINNKQTPVKEE